MEFLLDRFPALGTAWWIEATLPIGVDHGDVHAELTSLITTFEARYSRFRPDSLVGILNRERVLRVPDPACLALFRYAQELFTRTEGTFNCLVGEVLVARGYGDGRAAAVAAALPSPESDLIITEGEIRLETGSFDPGGFGKGYLVDELATLLRSRGVASFLINGGGDMYGSTDDDAPLTIHLEHPTEVDTYLGTVALKNRGFAASSPFKRVWRKDGRTEHHIIGETEAASFVLAKSARDADAFATAVLLLPEAALTDLAEREGLGVARYHPATSTFFTAHFPFQSL